MMLVDYLEFDVSEPEVVIVIEVVLVALVGVLIFFPDMQILSQFARVKNLFPFPPQPPYIKLTHLEVKESNPNIGI